MSRSRALRRRVTALAVAAAVLAWPFALSGPATAAPFASDGAAAPGSGGNAAVVAAPGDAHIRLSLRASGLTKPIYVTSARDGTGRMFIVEQTGRIKILKNGHILATPFLSLAGKVSGGYEQGLLGLAFHPNFKTNRKLYVNYTNLSGNTVIAEYRVSATNPNVVNPSSKRVILKIYQPYDNHNGGMLAFGPDGYLYVGMGDGGGTGDPGNRAQNTTVLLGKMLRIDVNGTTATHNYRIPSSNPYVGVAGADEIWQTGMRNPWRWSFDRATGDLWIGDVGQGKYEEIDHAVKTGSGAGRGANWGWKVMEGTHCYSPSSGCDMTGKTLPLLDYDHTGGQCAVTGGYVYRGTAIPALVGGYVFGDFCTGEIWVVPANATSPADKVLLLDTNLSISSFGENGGNELLVTDLGGRVYRIEQG